MLIFRPQAKMEQVRKLRENEPALGYIAYDESENDCGYIAFYLDRYSMEIFDIEVFDGDAETYEGLIRSALNYCGNRNAYVAYYSAENAQDVAQMLGFEKKEDRLYGEIPFLLQGHCCKGE